MSAMNIIYEGVDITDAVEVQKADIIDNAGGIADSIDLCFSDTDGLWSKWKPQKGHKLNVLESGFSSGNMYVDSIVQSRGSIRLKGLSLPPGAKTEKSKAWESIRFMEMAKNIAYGFTLEAYGVSDYSYSRIDQLSETDYSFLSRRCIMEGYAAKVCNGKLVIYDERSFEARASVKTIYQDGFDGDFEFKDVLAGLYSACTISCSSMAGTIQKEFRPMTAPAGPTLKPRIYVENLAQAERFSRGLLRAANKHEKTGRIQVQLDPELAAGSCVDMNGVGLADGKYFIEQAIHRLKHKKTVLKLRKPLEGY